MTPKTEGRVNQMHRGMSCISVIEPKEKEEKKVLNKAHSSSFDKPKPQSKVKKRTKKKLNVKQSSLAQHFSENLNTKSKCYDI